MNDLTTPAHALTETLAEEQQLYGSLLELAAREERAIVGGDVRILTEITDEKEQLLELLAALESERMTALTAFAAVTGHAPGEITLTEAAASLEAGEGALLTRAGEQLRTTALELRDANDRNAALLRSSRDLVDRWIQYLRTVLTGALAYNADGGLNDAVGRRVLDRSA
jgi:flagellar biosynthesis/type III secretory pathway chaperone